MKQLNDFDIANMIGDNFIPDDVATKKSVQKELHLSTRIPQTDTNIPEHVTIDFHNHTEEEAWQMLSEIAFSGVRNATVITGASGILKIKFQDWVRDSVLSPHIASCIPLNNGSFEVKFKKLPAL